MLKIDLTGKTSVITGSTSGIGFAIAKSLACAGSSVVINGRNQEAVTKSVNFLKEKLPDASIRGVAADLSEIKGFQKFVDEVPCCDILINNLGIYGISSFFEISDEEWQRYWDVNIMVGVRLSREYMKDMMKKNWGRIIFISSESAYNIPADMVHYGMTKTAVLGLARGLAKVAAKTGVTVNSVLPGPTFSEGLISLLSSNIGPDKTLEEAGVDFVNENRPSSIIGRVAQLDEVANMVSYLASPLSSATTGAALRADGGIVESI